MHKLFNKIVSVGFDLDQTLYPLNPKIDNLIRQAIAIKVLEKKPELKNINDAKLFYEKEYKRIGSGTQVLRNLGYSDAQEIMYNSLQNQSILPLIKRDDVLVNLLKRINHEYDSFLITASPKNLAIQKLNRIGIDSKLFDIAIFGDTTKECKKIDGSIFKYFLVKSSYLPEQHVYVGDSLNADILPAQNVGMKTIIVRNQSLKADFFVEKIYDLEKILL